MLHQSFLSVMKTSAWNPQYSMQQDMSDVGVSNFANLRCWLSVSMSLGQMGIQEINKIYSHFQTTMTNLVIRLYFHMLVVALGCITSTHCHLIAQHLSMMLAREPSHGLENHGDSSSTLVAQTEDQHVNQPGDMTIRRTSASFCTKRKGVKIRYQPLQLVILLSWRCYLIVALVFSTAH